jgi:hypothetical protein
MPSRNRVSITMVTPPASIVAACGRHVFICERVFASSMITLLLQKRCNVFDITHGSKGKMVHTQA